MKNRVNRFSLMELVILILLVLVLVAIWVPTMIKSKESAIETSCGGNLKQCSNALIMYAQDNNSMVCTYGINYTPWYKQPGVPKHIGFKNSKLQRYPLNERPMTLCPDIFMEDKQYYGLQSYGTPWFIVESNRADYASYGCEEVVDFGTNLGQIIYINKIPKTSDYVLLADSAFTSLGDVPRFGMQSCLVLRTGYISRGISLRHQGEANIAYADGHVSTTADRAKLKSDSKVTKYVDATGQKIVETK